jgi:hypothetical protein
MRLTIIPSDKAVYKDGVSYFPLDMSSVPLDVHALQWVDVDGWIEFKDEKPNQNITELPDWANICAQEWDVADYAAKHPPAPTPEELLQECKFEAKQRLEATDYSELPDVKAVLVNSSEFTTYRAQIRELYLNPVVDPVWPTVPKAQWAVG